MNAKASYDLIHGSIQPHARRVKVTSTLPESAERLNYAKCLFLVSDAGVLSVHVCSCMFRAANF